LSRLYVPSDTFWVDRTSQVSFTPIGEGRQDPTTFVARQPLYDGDSYTARASVPVPTAAQLRGAGTDYPDWVTSAYLQVPDGLTDRVRALAQSLGQGQATPFDQATAVTNWLRDNIHYSRVTDAPPANREPLDWFLFDYKVGFCNFYASSEVMMLRVIGVPSRLAVGYASGTQETSSGVYEVRALDSHAWPEVFFPGFGWVPFEPTVSQPDIRRPENSGPLGADQNSTAGGTSSGNPADPLARLNRFEEGQPLGGSEAASSAGARFGWVTYPLAAMGLILLLGWLALNLDPAWKQAAQLLSWRGMRRLGLRVSSEQPQAFWEAGGPTSRIYLAWSSWLPRLGVEIDRADTPFERIDRLASVLPEAESSSRRIVDAYVAERFGGRSAPREDVERTWSEVHRLFWETYLSRLGGRLLAIVQDPQRRDVGRRQHVDVTMGPR
jgi:transglutaminase-like putative cysteine protease